MKNSASIKAFVSAVILFFFAAAASAQTVTLSNACVTLDIVKVQGTLTGAKGIPITGYTVDIIPASGSPIRIATNVVSSGGAFDFTGKTPDCKNITLPCQVRVTTNRQKSAQLAAKACVLSY